ncbi:hypothetical protein P3S68_000628 [Capsicum galapagoense]
MRSVRFDTYKVGSLNISSYLTTETQLKAMRMNLPSLATAVLLQEIARRCNSKVEFRTVVSIVKELQFSVEMLKSFISSVILVNDSSLRNNRVIPQLLTSVPALNGAASYLSETTSLFTHCFMNYSEPSSRDFIGQEIVKFGSAEIRGSPASNAASSSGGDLAVCRPSQLSVDAPLLPEGLSRSLSIKSSKSSSAATNSEDLSEGSSAQVLSTNISPNSISIFQGEVRRTARGSADNIGWLQRASRMPPAEDQTDRFVEILDDIRHELHRLPNSVVYLLVPGLFSNHGPLYFVNTKTSFSKMGLACHIAKIHSEASVEKKAREMKDYIEEIYWSWRKML